MYSTDEKANRDNPFTPAPGLPLNDQFLYRFSGLEEAVRSGFRRIDERMDRIQTELHDRNIEVNTRITTLENETHNTFQFKRARLDKLTDRVQELETWSKVLMARIAIVLAAVVLIWTVFAPTIRSFLGVANG